MALRCTHLDPAEGQVQETRFKGPGPAFADCGSFPASKEARSARMPHSSVPVARMQSAQVLKPQLAGRPTILFLASSEGRTLAATTEQVGVPAARSPHRLSARSPLLPQTYSAAHPPAELFQGARPVAELHHSSLPRILCPQSSLLSIDFFLHNIAQLPIRCRHAW